MPLCHTSLSVIHVKGSDFVCRFDSNISSTSSSEEESDESGEGSSGEGGEEKKKKPKSKPKEKKKSKTVVRLTLELVRELNPSSRVIMDLFYLSLKAVRGKRRSPVQTLTNPRGLSQLTFCG